MKKVIQIIITVLFGIFLFIGGYQAGKQEFWNESYVLPGSNTVLQFMPDGQQKTIESGHYQIASENGIRQIYMVEDDEENLDDSFPYTLCVNDDNTVTLAFPEISGIDLTETTEQTLEYVSGTDGLSNGKDLFDGRYRDKAYDVYEIEFMEDGQYISAVSAKYKIRGNHRLVVYGKYGKTVYTYERDLENGELRLQTNGTFDVTYTLQR